MKREPVAPSRLIADVPGQLEDLIMSMLAKLPTHRPARAAEIGQRLESIAWRMQRALGAPIDRPVIQLLEQGGRGGGRAGGRSGMGLRQQPARPRWGSPRTSIG